MPTRIGGRLVRSALIAGAGRVIRAREAIDRINVFPVPDGDTGTNLAFTFHAVLAGARSSRSTSVAEVCARAARDSIDGARGNSGAILAQFFQGLSEGIGSRRSIDLPELALALERASVSARSALAEPREGTILSVIADFARSSAQVLRRGMVGLAEWADSVLRSVRQALQRTETQLEVLRRAHVVDAGAMGFVEFLEGVMTFVRDGRHALRGTAAPATELPAEALLPEDDHGHECSAYRWCTECLLSGESLDVTALRQQLSALPLDCLVVVGGGSRVRVHAHLDQPSRLFEVAGRHGKLVQRKADDMRAQARARVSPHPVAVVVDSAADLPEALAERLGIHRVPVRINFGGEEFLDGVTLSSEELFTRMQHGETPRTSQPPAGEFRRLYDQLASHHDAIVSVQLSSRLSGTWQAASSAARHGGDGKVQVLDTLNASAGQAWLAVLAAELAHGGADAASIAAAVAAARPRTHTYAVLPDLRYACAGGRLPPWTKWVADKLGLVIEIGNRTDGKIGPKGAFIGRSDWPERFAKRMGKRFAGHQARLILADCLNPEGADRVEAALRQGSIRITELHRVSAGTALGAHAGPGAVIVGLQELP
jgi:DegV family protein with EDD domain